ncbi:MAG: hypothetical protein U0X73_17660 [Thermoanaerobaculia bacterium]
MSSKQPQRSALAEVSRAEDGLSRARRPRRSTATVDLSIPPHAGVSCAHP